jgi:2-methylisocitrate lyase-like PEP mutase family enzyme
MNRNEKAETFKALHTAPRGFVMPNAWDAGSAILFAEEGFGAVGTTSSGIALSLGRPDFEVPDARLAVSREEMFARVRQIVDAIPLPVNGDLQDGYGGEPESVAETVRLAMELGLAGGNIEDHNPRQGGVHDEGLAVARIRAARAAVEAEGGTFVLNAKLDALALDPHDDLGNTIRRANLCLEAGADCVFPCGAADLDTVRTFVREIDGPVNIVLGWTSAQFTVPSLLDAGVKRISLGGSIARSALGFVRGCARELRDRGTIGFAAGQIGQRELNSLFLRAAAARSEA